MPINESVSKEEIAATSNPQRTTKKTYAEIISNNKETFANWKQ